MPMLLTPDEATWFKKQKTMYPFISGYRDREWLDAHFAEHQDLVRSARDSERGLLALASEHHVKASVHAGGVADALARGNVLGERLNELDPDSTPTTPWLCTSGRQAPRTDDHLRVWAGRA